MYTLSSAPRSVSRTRYSIHPAGNVRCYDCGRSTLALLCGKVGPVWDDTGERFYSTYHCGCDPDGVTRRTSEVGDHMARRHAWLEERGL